MKSSKIKDDKADDQLAKNLTFYGNLYDKDETIYIPLTRKEFDLIIDRLRFGKSTG
jgi:hypothetical protein